MRDLHARGLATALSRHHTDHVQFQGRWWVAEFDGWHASTDAPLEACPSCQRALIYGALAHISAAILAIRSSDPRAAYGHATVALKALIEPAKVDFAGTIPDSDEMTDEEFNLAVASFYEARVETYVDEATGAIVFGPHEGGGDPVAVGR